MTDFSSASEIARAPATEDIVARKLDHHVRLTRDEREILRRALTSNVRTIRARNIVIEAGERSNEILVVLSGWAARYGPLQNNRRQIVAFHLPGDVCEFNIFLMGAFDHAVEAVTPMRVAGISRTMLGTLAKAQPRLNQALWWESVVAGAIQRGWTVNVARRRADQRVAHLLCELYVRLHAVGLARDLRAPLPLTQPLIGQACGMTAIHVNRTLRALRAADLIEMMHGWLTIRDWNGLCALAQFDPLYLHELGRPFLAMEQHSLLPVGMSA